MHREHDMGSSQAPSSARWERRDCVRWRIPYTGFVMFGITCSSQ